MFKAYKQLLDELHEEKTCIMMTFLDNSNNSILDKVLFADEKLETQSDCLNEDILSKIRTVIERGELTVYDTDDDRTMIFEPIKKKPRLLVFGGGHISKHIVEFSSKVGFEVWVIDDRISFANKARFPDAINIICDCFQNALKSINLQETDFVVIVTRGHRFDGMIVREILKHDVRYVGMIGSKRRVKGMMLELGQEGYPEDRIKKVCSPIGIDIGAVTPEEIGVSIVAQLIRYKNSINDEFMATLKLEFDQEVIEEIVRPSDIPKAIITIINTKGSVPRKAGAKMVYYYDGKTVGSIGGGCSEAEILMKSRLIIEKGGFSIEHVDMTGDIAESNGMVCGGTMDVLIESIHSI